jgi:hypothetical protein
MSMNHAKSKIAIYMAVCILFLLLFSELFINTHREHNCTGIDCPICAEIQFAEVTIQQMGSAITAVFILFISACLIASAVSITNPIYILKTPVDMKVRIND